MKIFKIAQSNQDFGGYYSGNVPDYAANLIGTPSVDASQISSAFGRSNEAIKMVNSFVPDALLNIAFIFNFSKGDAFGVYVPALDRAIKTKALTQQLKSKGYDIVQEGDMLTAKPTKDEKSPEQTEEEIKALWNQLESSGGTALGINVQKELDAARKNANIVFNKLKSSSQGVEIPNQIEGVLTNVLSVYNLAATIVHEAAHSKGGDEGAAQSAEQSFRASAQNTINEQYKKELSGMGLEQYFTPLEQGTETIQANGNNWYKTAQFFGYNPGIANGKPRGSDLSGRRNQSGGESNEGAADFSMLFEKKQDTPIEKRLTREYMFPLEEGVNQEHDIIEEQLRKQTIVDEPNNISLLTEELLSSSHDDSASYKTMEELLEDTRPKPLLTPIRKAYKLPFASKLIKEATVFGWYNNLSISDGSTIPGLGDRVMAWEDRDEDFAWSDKETRQQARYNPEYDLKGFYTRWIEPRYKPQLWDDMVSDFTNTHPAKRFAAKVDPELMKIINILGTIQRNISEKTIRGTRLVVSGDIAPMIERFFGAKDGIETKTFPISRINESEPIFAVWIFHHGVSEEDIKKSEEYFGHKEKSPEVKEIAETILGTKSVREKSINEIVNAAKEISEEYDISDMFIVGSFAREKVMRESIDVTEMDFMCSSFSRNIKIGSLMAKKLGVKAKMSKKSNNLYFSYKGIFVYFQGEIDISELTHNLNEEDQLKMSSSLSSDLGNRDFTINMLAYNVRNQKVEDPLGVSSDLKNKIIKTRIDPVSIIQHNPMVVLRALKMKLKYHFEIDEALQRAMIENSYLLFDGRYPESKIIFARENVKDDGINEAKELFEEFGLSKIEEI